MILRLLMLSALLGIAATQRLDAQQFQGYYLVPGVAAGSSSGGDFTDRGSLVVNLAVGRRLHSTTKGSVTGSLYAGRTFKEFDSLICRYPKGMIGPGPTECVPDQPALRYGGFAFGIQSASQRALLFGVSVGPALVQPRDQRNEAARSNAFGWQSRIDASLRLMKPVWLNVAGESLLMPNYARSSLNVLTLNVGFRLQ